MLRLLWFYFIYCTVCSRDFVNQWGGQTKTNRDLLKRVFSRLIHAIYISLPRMISDWFIVLFTCAMNGQGNYFGFGFTTLSGKVLYSMTNLFQKKSRNLYDPYVLE